MDGKLEPGNADVDFRGERRANDTHASTTDPEARLMRKGLGKEAKLSFSAHALMDNRHGLVMDFRVDIADGRAEWRNALAMLDHSLPQPALVRSGPTRATTIATSWPSAESAE
jgi:hypothetical protein